MLVVCKNVNFQVQCLCTCNNVHAMAKIGEQRGDYCPIMSAAKSTVNALAFLGGRVGGGGGKEGGEY